MDYTREEKVLVKLMGEDAAREMGIVPTHIFINEEERAKMLAEEQALEDAAVETYQRREELEVCLEHGNGRKNGGYRKGMDEAMRRVNNRAMQRKHK